MFSLHERSVMHAFAETVAPRRWWWGPAPRSVHGHDFAAHSLRNTAWLHRRIDADYNGWWMCLIPTAIIQDIGLPLPMFIKWDDAEYGMRATGAGYPVMSQPGVAVWHVPWQDKDDAIDWQAYFHERNRLVSALLHQPCPRGGHLIKDSLATALKHLLSMRYSTAALQMMAIEDVLTGPGHLHAGIATKIAEIRAFRKDFPDAQARDRVDEFPPPRRAGPPRHPRTPEPPKSRLGMLRRVGAATLRHLRPARPSSLRAPEAVISHVDQHWWWLSRFDSALVSSAEGTTTFWYRRDAKRFRALLLRGVVLHARLLLTWPRLRRDYRERLPELTSARRWRETFKASGPGRA
jgi:galactofuranosylgalactofuranosylrhamnosyl-N-acetylglucosaminyl-diphospho-decaprenol beta-1,5/1,6-galactofuranosyltransferase